MKMRILLLVTALSLLVSTVTAAYAKPANSDKESGLKVKFCANLDLRKLSEGSKCRTSKNTIFKLVKRTANGKEVWEDLSKRTYWSAVLSGHYKYDTALEICRKFSSAEARGHLEISFDLPSKEEYESAEQSGFREVIANEDELYFWTSTPYEMFNRAYIFDGSDGAGDFFVEPRDFYYPVRCVGH